MTAPGLRHSATVTLPVVAVVGVTAAGKSDLGVGLALALGGEVVNTDSMQLYRGMDIGTAKLSAPQRRGVRHHLLDVWDVTRTATVAEFRDLARTAITDVGSRGSVPVLVGGSGLYVRAALDVLDFPGTDPRVRARLEAELAASGPSVLHLRLGEIDPQAAARISSGNGRRIVRALEVIEITGRPFTATLPEPSYAQPAVQLGVDVPRAALNERIERRVGHMWAQGFVDEVRDLEMRGLRQGRTASRALGYAQVLLFLAGECSEEEARHETVRATKRFARRQESWFRRDARVHWLAYDDPSLLERAIDIATAAAPVQPE